MFLLENQIKLPPIVPLVYKGEKVLTNVQLAELFSVTKASITHIYGRNKSSFVKGIDYYDLRGKEFNKFKAENLNDENAVVPVTQVNADLSQSKVVIPERADGTTTIDNQPKVVIPERADGTSIPDTPANLIKGGVLKVWTKGVVFKLSKHIHTDNAKLIYVSLAQGYFYTEPASLPPAKEIQDDGCSVYAFEMSNGTVKIGISNNPPDRAKNLEWETHLKVTNIFYITVETRRKAFEIEVTLHKYFAAQCVQKEYFLIDFNEACAQIKQITANTKFEKHKKVQPVKTNNQAEQMIELLKNSASITDENLRNEIIRETAKLILGKDF